MTSYCSARSSAKNTVWRIHQGLRCWGRGEGSGSLPDRLSLSLFITAADVLAVHSLQSCLHMLIMSAKNSPGNFSWRWKNDRLPHWPFKTSHTPSFFLSSFLVSFFSLFLLLFSLSDIFFLPLTSFLTFMFTYYFLLLFLTRHSRTSITRLHYRLLWLITCCQTQVWVRWWEVLYLHHKSDRINWVFPLISRSVHRALVEPVEWRMGGTTEGFVSRLQSSVDNWFSQTGTAH